MHCKSSLNIIIDISMISLFVIVYAIGVLVYAYDYVQRLIMVESYNIDGLTFQPIHRLFMQTNT